MMIKAIAMLMVLLNTITPSQQNTKATVTSINHEHNTITFTDVNGNDWIWESIEQTYGVELGKEYTIEFDDMNTIYLYDDEIIDFYEV